MRIPSKVLKIPYEEIIKKIKEKTNISELEIETKINEKLNQLSGLISKEGAPHIVANELGVKIIDEYTGRLEIKNILPGIRNLETIGKVISKRDVYEFKTETREGKVASFVLADETGAIRVVLWGSQTDKLKEINLGDTIKVIGGYVKENNSLKEVHLNDRSQIIKNPDEEVKINIKHGIRKSLNEITEADIDIEILGYVKQVFIPNFFEVCPNCNKRIKQGNNGFSCDLHGIITPEYSYVMNLVIDDTNDTIRAVFFRKQVEELLKLSKDELMRYRLEPESFNSIKNNLPGTQLKLKGSVKKNTFFNRLEFIVREVQEANPEEELKRLEGNNS